VTLDEQIFRASGSASNGTYGLRFEGELDVANVPRCEALLPQWLDNRATVIELDLSKITFADSSALRFLVDLKRAADIVGKRLLVRDASDPVLRLFEMAGLTAWFDYVEGHGPSFETCPLCSRDVLAGSSRCLQCGGAL
jgi:anti-anti-sigma factor